MNVLVDHHISPHIAREWLAMLVREGGWAFISNDQRIWRNPQECAAMLAARVIGFFLEPAWRKRNVTVFEQAGPLIM